MKRKYILCFIWVIAIGIALFAQSRLNQKFNVIGSASEDGIFQIYYYENGKYSEEKSTALAFRKNSIFDFKMTIPGEVDLIRVDPINKAGEVIIFNGNYGTGTFFHDSYHTLDLSDGPKNLNMAHMGKKNDGSFILTSLGDDPSFEITLKKSGYVYQKVIIFFATFSLMMILSITIFNYYQQSSMFNLTYLFGAFIPFSIALIFSSIFYPGFLSYDGLHSYRGAIYGVKDSIWPPMVSYVWRFVNLGTQDLWGMFFAQILLLMCSFFGIIYRVAKNVWYVTLVIFSFFFLPYMSGTMAVIFKDVLMAAFLLSAMWLILLTKDCKNEIIYWVVFSAVILALFFGVSARHNAMAAALPIIFYIAIILGERHRKGRYFVVSVFFFLSCLVYFPKLILDNYTMPQFEKIQSPTSSFLAGVQLMDLAGGSVCSDENLLVSVNSKLSLDSIRSGYDPRHANLSSHIFSEIEHPERIGSAWWSAFLVHPLCMLNNKILLTKYLVGFNSGPQFIVTDPGITSNEFGFKLEKSQLRDSAVSGIIHLSNFSIMKTWCLYFVALLGFIIILIRKIQVSRFVVMMLGSGVSYLISLIAFGNAADARLTFYTSIAIFLASAIQIWQISSTMKKSFSD